MSASEFSPEIDFFKLFPSAPEQAIYICVPSQTLYFFVDNALHKKYPVSTSEKGTGNRSGSLQTPTGLHLVAKKIGEKIPLYGRFIGREYTGEEFPPLPKGEFSKEDVITTRIIHLKGAEPGINSGDSIDSYQRFIYLHGTNEEWRIGRPASHGCIRMNNEDVIELFDRIKINTPVLIAKTGR